MISDSLFEQILLAPARKVPGGKLLIVSGFASAGMADRHMSILKKENIHVSISLIVGMSRAQGIEETQHRAFKRLVEDKPHELNFDCMYVYQGNPVHAKTYLWLDENDDCIQAFCGSVNYTITGFSQRQIEAVSSANPESVKAFYTRILKVSASCLNDTIDDVVPLIHSTQFTDMDESVILPLVMRNGETHRKSGLNWGQRSGRDHDQAYIPIPKDIREGNFFPPRGEQFTALTDDGFSIIFVRAQDDAKALHSTLDNSEIGRYIRQRIGVESGEYVTRQHLLNYGRLDVGFTKIDNETYLMDFRPNLEPGIEE